MNPENGNKSKPLLCDAFIDALPHTDEKTIDKYTKQISTELYHLSKQFRQTEIQRTRKRKV